MSNCWAFSECLEVGFGFNCCNAFSIKQLNQLVSFVVQRPTHFQEVSISFYLAMSVKLRDDNARTQTGFQRKRTFN